MRKFFDKLLSGNIPADDPRQEDRAYMQRVRTMHGSGLAIAFFLPLTVAQFVASRQWLFCALLLVTTSISFIVSRRATRGGSLEAALHIQLLLLALVLVLAAINLGGHHATGKAWLLVLPMYAGLVGGMRLAKLYCVVVLAVLLAFWIADLVGVRFDNTLTIADSATHDMIQTALVCGVLLGIIYFFNRARDQAERRLLRANAELELARKRAEAATEAKAAFLANMSHEIRTPMNGIIGMTELLMHSALSPRDREFAETIRDSGQSLLTIVNDILDFSKIEAGKLTIEKVPLDIRTCIGDVGAALAFHAASKRLELIIDVQPGVPHDMVGDPLRIRQCLMNFAGNAIKFTSAGEVVVSVSIVPPAAGATSAVLRFAVRDTGIGVAPDALSRLFEPFVQADTSTTRQFGGTGLGLSIVRRLVELMGGTCGAESMVGEGSTFWFELPLERAETTTRQAAAVEHSKLRTLVVAQNATLRALFERDLTNAGHHVTVTASGAEGLLLLQGGAREVSPYDVVLVDLATDSMSAFELGSAVRADARLAHIKLILLTSVDQPATAAQVAAAGFASYIHKPVRMHELVERLPRMEHGPTHSTAQITSPVTRPHASRTFAGHVLVVDDNIVNQKVAQRYLQRFGCTVSVAADGAEAMHYCERTHFDLILMDLQMPVMDGYETTRRIRVAESAGRRTPIVALTADAMSGHADAARDAGMDDYLTKPIELEHLCAVLDRFLADPAVTAAIATG